MDEVDEVIWEWLSELLLKPESLAEGLQGMQEETIRSNKALFDRLDIIEKRMAETEKRMEKLLDIYLSDGFPKELLQERKGRLDETLANLRREHTDISTHLQTQVPSYEQIAGIEAFCAQIRHRLEVATLNRSDRLSTCSTFVVHLQWKWKGSLRKTPAGTATAISCPNIAFIK